MARPTLRVGRGEIAILLAVLLLLTTAAAANYERNLRVERAARPYHVYADRELDRLIAAYREEVTAHAAKHRAARGGRSAPGQGVRLDERVRDFERAHRGGARERSAAAELAEREAVLHDLEAEKRARAGDGPKLARFVQRLVRI